MTPLPRPCLDCGRLTPHGSRCLPHQRVKERAHTNERKHDKAQRQVRHALDKAGQGTCSHCGGAFFAKALQVHHVIPKSEGGVDTLENLAILCRACHVTAHGGTPKEWTGHAG
jgi:5-methylcytosine-specific restriction enzyme A